MTSAVGESTTPRSLPDRIAFSFMCFDSLCYLPKLLGEPHYCVFSGLPSKLERKLPKHRNCGLCIKFIRLAGIY